METAATIALWAWAAVQLFGLAVSIVILAIISLAAYDDIRGARRWRR